MKSRGPGSVSRGPLVPRRADTPQKRIVFMKTSVGRCSGLLPRCGRLAAHSRKAWLKRRGSATWRHLKPHTLLSWSKGPLSKCTMPAACSCINTSWIVRIRWQLCGVTSTLRVCRMHSSDGPSVNKMFSASCGADLGVGAASSASGTYVKTTLLSLSSQKTKTSGELSTCSQKCEDSQNMSRRFEDIFSNSGGKSTA